MYEYTALVRYVFDGDTIKVDIDLGFGTWLKGVVVRLKGVDAPQPISVPNGTLEGNAVKAYLMEKILDREVTMIFYKSKQGKYDRYAADVYYASPTGEKTCLNEDMLDKKLAKKFEG